MKSMFRIENGFTLAELLIALAILGVIATFTIPKVLSAQQDGQHNAVAKESAAAISGAFQNYIQQNGLSSTMSVAELTPFLNYVATHTGDIDRPQGATTLTCNTTYRCIRLHNGSVLQYTPMDNFGGTASTHAIYFYVDPDGQVTDGTTNGPGKSVVFFLYTTGRLTTWGNLLPNTGNGAGATYNPDATKDPPWFQW